MSEIERLIPRKDLVAWHEASDIVGVADGGTVSSVADKSGNSRTLTCSSTHPVLSKDSINGVQAVSWDGTKNPLTYSGSLAVKHVFIVASFTDATFPAGYAGLLSDVGTFALLLGNASDTKFFDTDYETVGAFTYKKRDVQFAENSMTAAMGGAFSIYEISLDVGWALDGIQIGQDRGNTSRKWKGKWTSLLMYNALQTGNDRLDIYEYLAMKFLLWKQVSSGLDVWPFQPSWSRPLSVDKRVLAAESVSGAFKARAKGSAKSGIEPHLETRWPEEVDAAKAFWDAKYPASTFVFRDYAFSPERDTEMRFLSGLPQQANDYRDIDYSFQSVQV